MQRTTQIGPLRLRAALAALFLLPCYLAGPALALSTPGPPACGMPCCVRIGTSCCKRLPGTPTPEGTAAARNYEVAPRCPGICAAAGLSSKNQFGDAASTS